jgi:hypothetical protein
VIWFSEPVPYEQTRLDADLVNALRAWDASYQAGLTRDTGWRSPELRTAFVVEGARLARRLADQIGDEFQVEHDVLDGRRRVRGPGPARNPEAAAAFRRRAAEAVATWEDLRRSAQRAAEDEASLEWRG